MAEKSGDLEGDPCGIIDFHVVNRNKKLDIVTTDCLLKLPLIRGLKLDLADQFKVEGVQTWKYKDNILQDEKCLWDYGIDGTETVVINVTVS